MNIPAITSIENALRIYYQHSEIGNKEMVELFGKRSSATFSRMKKLAKHEMIKDGIPSYSSHKINTVAAYKTWGIDIHDLEKRIRKIKDLDI